LKRLCESAELHGKQSIRFTIGRVPSRYGEVPLEGFAIRTEDGVARGYANACPHRQQPVDLGDGKLFSPDGLLECQAHGAYFDPVTGICDRGPCPGRSLRALDLSETEGAIWLDERSAIPVNDPD
jgi:nitrite reductase/ring-hydroxylating ferredoxin subunit